MKLKIKTDHFFEVTYILNVCDFCAHFSVIPEFFILYLQEFVGRKIHGPEDETYFVKICVDEKKINNITKSFLKTYVQCHWCNSYNTKLEMKSRAFYVNCLKCKTFDEVFCPSVFYNYFFGFPDYNSMINNKK